MADREKFLQQARTYIGQTGYGVCILKLKIGFVCDWCAFSVSSIMNDCGFVGKYIKAVEGGAGTIPRYSDGKFGEWFRKGTKAPQAGDLFFLRYNDYPSRDKYFCDHVGIVEAVSGNVITTLEGNVDGIYGNWAATSTFKRKTRYLSDYNMYAFYRPFWKETTGTGSKTKTKKTTGQISQITSSKDVNFDVVVISADGVNIRSGAGTSYKILGAVPFDIKLHVSRQTSGGEYTWGLIEYCGILGWIALNFCQKVQSKGIDELAHEVIAGKWSAGDEREKLLKQAGYDYIAVQKRVNELLE